jgi:site-specific DNA-methyltransferase (adenine-specific)
VTQCKWDSVIDLGKLWPELTRTIKPKGAVVLSAAQPFTTTLISSKQEWFRYSWVWDKRNPTGFLDANRRPLRRTEDILVFAEGQTTYNPQMEVRGEERTKGRKGKIPQSEVYGKYAYIEKKNNIYFPTNLLSFSVANRNTRTHPTEKPVALMEYLVKTYTHEGETVLDFCCGSGSTGVASVINNRRFIGIEKDAGYCAASHIRIGAANTI